MKGKYGQITVRAGRRVYRDLYEDYRKDGYSVKQAAALAAEKWVDEYLG